MIEPELFKQLNALSTTEVSDAMDSCGVEGALLAIKPLFSDRKLIGRAYTIEYSIYEKKPDRFNMAANYIDDVPEQAVILIDNKGRDDCTIWGDILTQVAIHKNIAGTVVHGAIRDVECIAKSKYPVYCTATSMRSGKNRVYKSGEQCPLLIEGITIHPGDIVFADDNGVLIIPSRLLNEIVTRATRINETEKKILAAVKEGSTLEQARIKYRYDQPWLNER